MTGPLPLRVSIDSAKSLPSGLDSRRRRPAQPPLHDPTFLDESSPSPILNYTQTCSVNKSKPNARPRQVQPSCPPHATPIPRPWISGALMVASMVASMPFHPRRDPFPTTCHGRLTIEDMCPPTWSRRRRCMMAGKVRVLSHVIVLFLPTGPVTDCALSQGNRSSSPRRLSQSP